jgi:hypothetical protein
MKMPQRLLMGLAALALIGGVAACESDDGEEAASSSPVATATVYNAVPVGQTVPAITVTARDFTLDAPAAFPAGRVEVTFRNEGQDLHHAQFLRLADGVTADQFIAAFTQGADGIEMLAADAGGPGTISPGKSTIITQDLTPGSYVMLCFIPGADEIPHVAKGMIKPFQVTGTAPLAEDPKADGEVILGDFTIIMPELKAGKNTLAVTNAGAQSHEIVLAKLTNGATFAEAEAFLQGRGGLPSVDVVGGTVGMARNQKVWITMDLPAGDYFALCFITDEASGTPHVFLGMSKLFTVQ